MDSGKTTPPAGGNVNRPDSGVYGEGAALESLKKSLPTTGATPAAAPAGAPVPSVGTEPVAPVVRNEGRPRTGAAVPPGIPSVLLAPTQQPQIPVGTPLASAAPAAPGNGASTPSQSRLAMLDMLANSPDVSPTTREWAQNLMDALLGVE